MVNRRGDVWEILFDDHKTAYLGKNRTVFVGPKAQKILARYLLRDADSPCFSPAEAMRQRRQAMHDARTTPLNQGNRPGSNRKRRPKKVIGSAYTTSSYRRAIAYACKCARIDPWGPNRLRHTAATEIRKQFGLEAAASILGHSEIATTQIYAETDRNRAIEVAKALG
jgi:integrase